MRLCWGDPSALWHHRTASWQPTTIRLSVLKSCNAWETHHCTTCARLSVHSFIHSPDHTSPSLIHPLWTWSKSHVAWELQNKNTHAYHISQKRCVFIHLQYHVMMEGMEGSIPRSTQCTCMSPVAVTVRTTACYGWKPFYMCFSRARRGWNKPPSSNSNRSRCRFPCWS